MNPMANDPDFDERLRTALRARPMPRPVAGLANRALERADRSMALAPVVRLRRWAACVNGLAAALILAIVLWGGYQLAGDSLPLPIDPAGFELSPTDDLSATADAIDTDEIALAAGLVLLGGSVLWVLDRSFAEGTIRTGPWSPAGGA